LLHLSNLNSFDSRVCFSTLYDAGRFEDAFIIDRDFQIRNNINSAAYRFFYFSAACRHGYLEEAKRIYAIGEIDIHQNDEEIFNNSRGNGQLEVVQWLYGLGDFAFLLACECGHFNIIKWIWSLDAPDRFNIEKFREYSLIENFSTFRY
jgi:hypothetical protein